MNNRSLADIVINKVLLSFTRFINYWWILFIIDGEPNSHFCFHFSSSSYLFPIASSQTEQNDNLPFQMKTIEWIWLNFIEFDISSRKKILKNVFCLTFHQFKTNNSHLYDYWLLRDIKTNKQNPSIRFCGLDVQFSLVTPSSPICDTKKLITCVAFNLELWNWLLSFESFGIYV